jgi:tRNA pseudouridine synthase 10
MGWHKKPKRFTNFEEFEYTQLSFDFNNGLNVNEQFIEELRFKLFNLIEHLSKAKDFKSFLLSISWPDLHPETKASLRKGLQYQLTKEIQEKLGKEPDFEHPQATFLVDFNKNRVFLSLLPIFIKGNYCKFSRKLAQTDYFCPKCKGRGKKTNLVCEYCGGLGRMTEESLAGLISPFFIKHFRGMDCIFHGAGREDSDVRMLNKGRPFIIEILQPEIRSVKLDMIEEEINLVLKEKVAITKLEFVTSKDVAPLKNALHDKIYLATILCSKKPDLKKLKFNEKIKVLQRTPIRVSKRRSDLVRTKFVELIEIKKNKNNLLELNGLGDVNGLGDKNCVNYENEFILKLRTSHGTYVKEFISGDSGRSNPSISLILGIDCVCKKLDVLEICTDNKF